MNNEKIKGMPGVTPKDVRAILDILSVNPDRSLYIHDVWCNALEKGPDGVPVVIDEKCKRCGMCELRCPDLAITLLQTRN